MRHVVFGMCVALLACQSPHEPASVQRGPSSQPECVPPFAPVGFRDPEAAYQRYAGAMNAQRWCDAIAAFAPEHRKNLVASTFKGLLLMAGLETPNRARYIEHLQTFCAKHGLDFGSPERVATLTAAMLDKRDLGAEFAPLTQLASRSPDAMYAELMTHVAQANGSAMAKLGPSLNDLTIHGDSANATAVRSDGRTVPIPFLKTANGWFITEP